MKNIISWIKSLFTRDTAQHVITAAKNTAEFLSTHEEELAEAQRLVALAEKTFTEPRSGATKWQYVINRMQSLWPEIKPHLISLLSSIAVNLLKAKLA